MKKGRIVKTSSDYFCKIVNVPDEVITYFEQLAKKYNNNSFVIDIKPWFFEGEEKVDIEVEVYDDYRE